MTIKNLDSIYKPMTLGLFAFLSLLANPPLAAADPKIFQANLERTGLYNSTGPEDTPTLAWKFYAGAPVVGTPLVYEGGVYFADFDGGVYAVNQSDGGLIWEKDLEGRPSFQIAINEDMLLVGRHPSTEDHQSYLLAINRVTGEDLWKFESSEKSALDSPMIHENTVFITSLDNYIHALNLISGEEMWRHPIQGGSRQPLMSDDILYFQDNTQRIYSLAPESGELLWSYAPPQERETSFSTPAIDDCCIYALFSDDSEASITTINKLNGKKEGNFQIEFSSMSPISIAEDIVYFGDYALGDGSEGSMNAINIKTGEFLWRINTSGSINSAASIAGDTLYFGSHDHYMYAVDRHTGEIKWRYGTGAGIASTPAVVDGRLYFGSIDGHVYVLE